MLFIMSVVSSNSNHARIRCLSLLQLHVTSFLHLLQLHAQMLRNHLLPSSTVATTLILTSAARTSNLHYAHALLNHQIPNPTTFQFNTLLQAHAASPFASHSFPLFSRMLASDVPPNSHTFTFLLKACAKSTKDFRMGEQVFAFMVKFASDRDVFSVNGLISMFAACGRIHCARKVFDGGANVRDGVAWNSLVSGYFNCGMVAEAREVFDGMPERGVVSWNVMINGYVKGGDVESAKRLFELMPERNVESWNTMVAGFARHGLLDEARAVFDRMPERNLVSWSAMITSCAQRDRPHEALRLFGEMESLGLKPNWATVVSVLSACAQCGALTRGKEVHMYVERNKMRLDSIIGTALIDMYAKCGCIESAVCVFHGLKSKDVYSWTAVIGGLVVCGHGAEALEYFQRMEKSGVWPNEITFVGVLSACSHGGWVELAKQHFDSMSKIYRIQPQMEHYSCMVDALGRAGHLEEAVSFVEASPMNNNPVLWVTLLGACSIHGNIPIGEYVANCVSKLKPDDGGAFVLLSNIYAMKGRWNEARNARIMMRTKGLRKCPGRSSIEVANVVHEFYAGDKSHPRMVEIYEKLDEIAFRLKLVGYAPVLAPVMHDIEDEEKENVLLHHSEKLAIAFGLVSTNSGTTIRIVKNIRVCYDCHVVAKLVSKEFRREIIMRDRTVFHHFKDGSCSCRDYW